MARVRVEVDEGKLLAVANASPELSSLLHRNAREIALKARAVYLARQRMSNEWRLSETTPPKYGAQFKVERVAKAKAYSWRVINVDPAAAWVEYGAHAGGRTFVLRYYPLKTALFAQGMTN